MKRFLREISKAYWKTNNDDRKLENYTRLKEHPGWEVHKEFLVLVLQEIGNSMLSPAFTKKSAEEKDILQRTNYNVVEVVRFLLDPVEELRKQAAIVRHNKKMEQGATERE